jgi:ABC-type sugar transport system substrate-binding protein
MIGGMRNLSPSLMAAALLVACALIGCEKRSDSNSTQPAAGGSAAAPQNASTGGGSSAGDKKITVAMLPKKKGIPYFTTCAAGAEEAAKELGNVTLIYDGPTDASPEKAASMIEKWTLQGVDVIAVSPNDPNVLAPAMNKARAKGVRVITWDADGDQQARELFVNQATAQEIGYAMVDALAKNIAGGSADPVSAEGEVAIVTATLTAANQNAWMEHMKARLAEKYPKLKLVEVKPCNEDQKLAFQVTQDLINA